MPLCLLKPTYSDLNYGSSPFLKRRGASCKASILMYIAKGFLLQQRRKLNFGVVSV